MRRTHFWLMFLVLIIATFLRLYQFSELPPGLYPDEAMNGNNALEAIRTGDYRAFYPENNGREGFFINIQAFFVQTFGNEPWVLRLPSALFGILMVLGVYFAGAELFGASTGLFASFFAATLPWHIIFSRIGFRAIMAPAFFIWALYLALRALRAKTSSRIYFGSLIGGAVFGLGLHSYIAYRILPLLFVILYLWYFTRRKGSERKQILFAFLLFATGAVLAFAPLGMYFLNNPQDFLGRTSQVSVFSADSPLRDLGLNILKTVGMFGVNGDYNWRHNIAGAPQLLFPLSIFFWLGIVLGMKHLASVFRKGARSSEAGPFLFVLLSLALAALPVVISNEGIPHALRAILMIPGSVLLAGYGAHWLWQKVRRYPASRLAAALFALFFILQAYAAYFITWGKNPNLPNAFAADYASLGEALRVLPAEMPKYIVVEAGGVIVRGIPMPSQAVMFLTDTFLPEQQKERNIFYVLPEEISRIPEDALVFELR